LIILIGLPGSGKSTVGRQLARRLSASFMDSDLLIEQRLGCSIREYFEREGEGAFRDVEEAVLADTVSAQMQENSSVVLATGGGAVIRENNRKLLHGAGWVVYLRSSPEDLYKRLRHDRNRPLLQVGDPMQRLRDLYAQRDPLYREAAHFQVETGRPSVATLVNMIAMQLDLAGSQAADALPVGVNPESPLPINSVPTSSALASSTLA
jgi:shikimate kinase